MSEETPKPTIDLDLKAVLPEEFVKRFDAKEFASSDDAQKALQEAYKVVLGRNGYGDVKTTQTGTHKAIQAKLTAAAKELEIDLEVTDQSQTADIIDQLKAKVADLRKTAKTGAGLSDAEKQQLADYNQLQKALKEANKELENERAKSKESLTKAQQEKLDYIKETAANSELETAIKNSADKRSIDLPIATIKTLFLGKYKVEAALDEAGKVSGFNVRNLDGSLAMKNQNDPLSLEQALLNLYTENKILNTGKQQNTPLPKNGVTPPQNTFGGLVSKTPILPWGNPK